MTDSQFYRFYATLDRVVDGDTVVIVLDLGFKIAQTHTIRLAGVDAPEMRTDAGKAARDYVVQWFVDHGSALLVYTSKAPDDKYGRYLADIYAGEQSLNADLVTSGHAVAYDGGKRG